MAPTNKQVTDMVNDVYNGFWKKWRDKDHLSDKQWDEIITEVGEIGKKYDGFDITVGGDRKGSITSELVNFFLSILEQRDREERGTA